MSKPAEIDNSQHCVTIFCVMPTNLTEATCPKDLFQAFKCCQENGFNISWKTEEEALVMTPNKEEVFILAEFSGKLFTYLRKFKCTIIGPQCLLVSVQKNDPLPEVFYPVFTVAMKGLVITSTGCNTQEKKDIQEKVQFMGGVYTPALSGNVTHLIMKSVADFSPKFKVAVSKDLPIMVPSWVDAVWAQSCKESVHGTDPIFAKFACPPFLGLEFCVTQIPSKEREVLSKIIENNGGHYSGQLELNKTNILIATAAEGEKFNYAKRWKIRCLKPDWIHHSLNKGYALIDTEKYVVDSSTVPPRSSTPESDRTMRFGNTSINSTIMNESHIKHVTHVNDTVGSSSFISSASVAAAVANNQWKEAIDAIDLGLSKKAGPFLDGCKILVSGFGGPLEEKLRRLLNNAGVARFNTVSESLTHVIVGQREDEHWKQIEQLGHKPHVVTAEWVVQSLRLQRAAPESRFLHPDFKIAQQDVFKNPEKPAPLSASVTNGEQEADSQMMQQYLTNDESEAAGDQPSGIFSGLTFQFSRDMDSDLAQELGDQILKNGGSLVAKKANYLVIEVGSQLVSTGVQGQIVNTLWIDDCIEKEELVEVEAYHNQIIVKDPKRMENYTVSFTGIPLRIKDFICNLITLMNGKPQETFSRKDLESRGLFKSTHLVCLDGSGQKYIKAQEWCVPAVDFQWILDCATSEIRPNEADYPPGCSSGKLTLEKNSLLPETPRPVESTPKESVVLGRRHKAQESTPLGTPRMPLNEVVTPQIPRMDPLMTPFAASGSSRLAPNMFNMPTPETPYGRLLNPDPSPDTRKLWKHALDNRVRLTPRPDEPNDSQTSQDLASAEDAANAAGELYFENLRKRIRFDGDGGKGLGPRLEFREKTASQPTTAVTKPFHGLIVYINKKVEDGHFELVKAVESLGGEIRYQHCQEVTHYVYQGKLPNGTKEVKQAREWHQKFVSPQWILDSEDAATRLDENHYPPSFNPSMALSLSFTPSQAISIPISQQKKRQGDTPRSQRKRRAEDDEPQVQPTVREDDEEDIEEEASKMAVFEELLQVNENLSRASEQLVPVTRKAPAVRLETGPVFIPATQVPMEAPESQTQVGWDLQNEKPAPSSNRVMLSGLETSEREKLMEVIAQLGGVFLNSSTYDDSATHVVISKLSCNEKLLASIAAGKWVMHPDWLIESHRKGIFVDESPYEWGNPSLSSHSSCSSSGSQGETEIAAAAHYWRLNRSQGPFHGMRAVLKLGDSKNASFKRLLEIGGGEVIDDDSDLDNGQANLCITDPKNARTLPLEVFARKGIYCVPMIFLRDIVMKMDTKTDWKQYVIPEFKQYLDQ